MELKIHILAIKDMAGLLKPLAATKLVGAIRAKFPDLPIHVHTHDTAGTGVASMIAALEAGADIVDCATDALSGLTSQPSLGAVVNALRHTERETELDPQMLGPINDYWEETRRLYRGFESTDLRSGNSDVYQHEMPGKRGSGCVKMNISNRNRRLSQVGSTRIYNSRLAPLGLLASGQQSSERMLRQISCAAT